MTRIITPFPKSEFILRMLDFGNICHFSNISLKSIFTAFFFCSVMYGFSQVPNPPTNLIVNPGDQSLLVSFTPPSYTGGSSIANYEYSTNNGNSWTAVSPASTGTSINITGLTNCTTYIIKVRAVNSSGPGSASMSVAVTPRQPGVTWTPRSTLGADGDWRSVTYGNGMFVAVATTGTGNKVMTSPDGIIWTLRASAADFNSWSSITYGNGLFVAVASNGFASNINRRVMTSPDGITWTLLPDLVPSSVSYWSSITYGNGLFVAVASSGTDRVMTSPNGIDWTPRTPPNPPKDNNWNSVTFGNGRFVAVAGSGSGNRVMTSTDGINWTASNSTANNSWTSVTYGNGLFVAVSSDGTNRVMTSPDGINWTGHASVGESIPWLSVTYGNGLFVAVTPSGSGVMTSPDGITWTLDASAPNNPWFSVTYGNGLFVSVASSGTNRVMTSSGGNLIPDKPVISSILRFFTNLSVAFSAPSDAGSSAISNYEYSTDNGITWVTRSPASTISPLTITGLTAFTTYQLKLRAVNSNGIGCESNMMSTTNNTSISCLNNNTISLTDDCTAILSSGMFTLPSTGGYFIYASTLEIPSSFQPGIIGTTDTVFGEGNWMYGIYNPFPDEKGLHQLICWGTFTTEDKIDPIFVGDTTGAPDVAGTAQVDESIFNQYGTYRSVPYMVWDDDLDVNDGTFQPHLWSCYQSTNHGNEAWTWPNDSARTFDTIRFVPNFTGYLTIIAASKLNTNESGDQANFDPVVAVYDEKFTSTDPCQNMIAFGESSFIPNPLAGLGFAIELENSSIADASQDGDDIFAPWLLHKHPVVRMDVKVAAGRSYYALITHREFNNSAPAIRVTDGEFEVYFMRNGYNGGGLSDLVDLDPLSAAGESEDDSIFADTSFAYFDFTCADVEAVRLTNQLNTTHTRYTGGDAHEMARYLGTTVAGSSATTTEILAIGTAWRNIASALLSTHGRDTALLDLNELDLSRSSHADAQKFMDSLLLNYGYMPMVIENCDAWDVKVTDSYQTFGDCGVDMQGWAAQPEGLNVSGIITRTFVVNDKGTKTDLDTAKIQLIFRNLNLYDVRLPHYTVNLECDEISPDGVVSTHPSSTGYPFVATLTGFVDLTPTAPVCNLAAGYQDVARVDGCNGSYKFRREWTVYDWCRPGTTVIYNQLIKVGDWTAPTWTTTDFGALVTITTNPTDCNGSLVVSAPVASDNCSAVTYQAWVYKGAKSVNNQVAYFANGAGTVSVSDTGTAYHVHWVATDACGNKSTEVSTSKVYRDVIAPSCVIDDLRSITLTNAGAGTAASTANGTAWVTAERLDEGSWDNCGTIVSKKTRRMTSSGMSAWADAVSFTCADEGTEVLVELQVTDRAGNTNVCWTYIKPVDKTVPACKSLAAVPYLCSNVPAGADLSSTSAVWNQFFADSITIAKVVTTQLCNVNLSIISTEANIDQCGYGYVNRYYEVHRTIDGKRHADTCYASIFFYESHDAVINLPADETKECSALDEVGVTFSENACDLITISTDDERFNATADECFKIFRTYRIINWCEYDGGPYIDVDPTPSLLGTCKDGVATTVTVKYTHTVKRAFNDYKELVTDANGVLRDTVDAGTTAGLANTAGATYVYRQADVVCHTQVDYNGAWEWTQVLKVTDNDEPVVTFTAAGQDSFPSYSNATGCPGAVTISATLTDDCTASNDHINVVETRINGTVVTTGTTESGAVATHTGNYPVGTHTITFIVRDGCGNVRTASKPFKVYDAKPISPVCIEGFAAELMPTGSGQTDRMATVTASTFLIGAPYTDCTGDSGVYRITKSDGKTAAEIFAATTTTLSFNCEDADKTVRVAIITRDGYGNQDYCITTVTVQDNVNPCTAGATDGTIAGLITTEDNNVVSGVEVSLNASSSKVTAVDGGYFFSGLALGGDYSIAPKKDAGYLNGVSTFDLVLISKHILGVTPLNSPYKLIAADVNNSSSITTLDLIQLRKLILSVDTKLANNTSWRFVPANYTFPVASNPWSAAFPEVLNINNLAGSVNGDFVAIKVGDVNNSAVIDVQPRSNATFAMNVEDIAIKAGNEYTVNFTSNASDVEGFQMALSYRGLELVDIVEGIAKVENFGTKFTGEGVILTSWNGAAANGKMFGLVFRATADSKLSEALSVSTRYINAEAYNNAGEAMNVALNFNSGAVAEAAFELKQNMPNPFKGETMIGFNLAEASKATLTINDVTGRVLKVVRGDFAKGANQISINSKDLPASGVLYYTLTAGEYTATKKMIIIE